MMINIYIYIYILTSHQNSKQHFLFSQIQIFLFTTHTQIQTLYPIIMTDPDHQQRLAPLPNPLINRQKFGPRGPPIRDPTPLTRPIGALLESRVRLRKHFLAPYRRLYYPKKEVINPFLDFVRQRRRLQKQRNQQNQQESNVNSSSEPEPEEEQLSSQTNEDGSLASDGDTVPDIRFRQHDQTARLDLGSHTALLYSNAKHLYPYSSASQYRQDYTLDGIIHNGSYSKEDINSDSDTDTNNNENEDDNAEVDERHWAPRAVPPEAYENLPDSGLVRALALYGSQLFQMVGAEPGRITASGLIALGVVLEEHVAMALGPEGHRVYMTRDTSVGMSKEGRRRGGLGVPEESEESDIHEGLDMEMGFGFEESSKKKKHQVTKPENLVKVEGGENEESIQTNKENNGNEEEEMEIEYSEEEEEDEYEEEEDENEEEEDNKLDVLERDTIAHTIWKRNSKIRKRKM